MLHLHTRRVEVGRAGRPNQKRVRCVARSGTYAYSVALVMVWFEEVED